MWTGEPHRRKSRMGVKATPPTRRVKTHGHHRARPSWHPAPAFLWEQALKPKGPAAPSVSRELPASPGSSPAASVGGGVSSGWGLLEVPGSVWGSGGAPGWGAGAGEHATQAG